MLNLIDNNNPSKIDSDSKTWIRLLSMAAVISISILSIGALVGAIIKCNTLYDKELTDISIQVDNSQNNQQNPDDNQ